MGDERWATNHIASSIIRTHHHQTIRGVASLTKQMMQLRTWIHKNQSTEKLYCFFAVFNIACRRTIIPSTVLLLLLLPFHSYRQMYYQNKDEREEGETMRSISTEHLFHINFSPLIHRSESAVFVRYLDFSKSGLRQMVVSYPWI